MKNGHCFLIVWALLIIAAAVHQNPVSRGFIAIAATGVFVAALSSKWRGE